MVYNWDGKHDECYRLYVTEKKSLDEVIKYWEALGFTPSKRAFQTQFKRWNFPTKQNPAHKNPELVARVKELWEKNVQHKDMVEVLHDEGFQISDRELLRLRLRFGWLLRESTAKEGVDKRGAGEGAGDGGPRKKNKTKKAKAVPGRGLIHQLANSILQESSSEDDEDEEEEHEQEDGVHTTDRLDVEQLEELEGPVPTDPVDLSRREARLQQLQAESDEKWRTRKRRRRTRGWGGLSADAPGEPPRYPSETTLDESKAYLGLDNEQYHRVRTYFAALCNANNVVKKTIAGPQTWLQVKEQLVRENAHLAEVFRRDPEAAQQIQMTTTNNMKALSLDVICMDVTKRLRTTNRMGVTEAKNVLGLNPDETRQIRSAFATKVKAAGFLNKTEAGQDQWDQLKVQWVNDSELLTKVFSGGEADPQYAEKIKALEITARDVLKRIRNENSKKEGGQKQGNRGPGPGPAAPRSLQSRPSATQAETETHTQTRALPSNANTTLPPLNNPYLPSSVSTDLQIDPTLLLAASDIIADASASNMYQHPSIQHQPPTQQSSYALAPRFIHSLPQPIYFRLHPHSQSSLPNKTVWLSIMQTGTVAEIRNLTIREHPGTTVLRFEGLVSHKMHGGGEREITVEIGDEEELGAYMEHVAGGKATFVVLLGLGSTGWSA
ncbi:hypothetical protein BDV96DRAFT_505867 [Lophiotrema nucula]|uniref:Uncharacterized protein n=1 Tax=Lophiotrema nucula TaxID=690887 RepID=A0A6A5YKF5_9PLEO|nr:hypothetical protein BDV96DRAFT_505867 [Lophiotrema nucula]